MADYAALMGGLAHRLQRAFLLLPFPIQIHDLRDESNVYGVIMKRPQFYVDFNELLESDLVALSARDEKLSSTGEKILLREGLVIDVYSDDLNDKGEPDNLIASGVVERNSSSGWAKEIRWCCRIDAQGIRHESEGEE